MQIYTRTQGLSDYVHSLRLAGRSIGFVPTMGALHEGHISLIDDALTDSDVVVCSLFVNPSQFNDAEDLLKYPRPHGQDLRMLKEAGCHVAFLPPVVEVYPPGLDTSVSVDLEGLDEALEGEFRPGHFDGMLQVVKRLLDITNPNRLYMGQKDYQQQLIVHKMIEQLELPVELVVCPIHREADGLAMSSRNRRMSPEARAEAPVLYRALQHLRAHWSADGDKAILEAKQMITEQGLKLEYLEVASQNDLRHISSDAQEDALALVAAWCDDIRLIDNIKLD